MPGKKLHFGSAVGILVMLVLMLYLVWNGYLSLADRLDRQEKTLAGFESRLESLEENMETLEAGMNRFEAEMESLETDLDTLEARLKLSEEEERDEILEIEGLVRVRDLDSTIQVDLRYATEDNFTGQTLYPVAICLLQRQTAEKLAAAQAEFLADGYRLLVWDAYRPLSVQEKLWEVVPDRRYVAPPDRGSNHNRGAAVDVTLVDRDGEKLLLPSGFDEFVPEASRSYPDMPAEARENMEYLTEVMVRNGFAPIESEWWHFNDEDAGSYPLLNLPLEEFASRYFSR